MNNKQSNQQTNIDYIDYVPYNKLESLIDFIDKDKIVYKIGTVIGDKDVIYKRKRQTNIIAIKDCKFFYFDITAFNYIQRDLIKSDYDKKDFLINSSILCSNLDALKLNTLINRNIKYITLNRGEYFFKEGNSNVNSIYVIYKGEAMLEKKYNKLNLNTLYEIQDEDNLLTSGKVITIEKGMLAGYECFDNSEDKSITINDNLLSDNFECEISNKTFSNLQKISNVIDNKTLLLSTATKLRRKFSLKAATNTTTAFIIDIHELNIDTIRKLRDNLKVYIDIIQNAYNKFCTNYYENTTTNSGNNNKTNKTNNINSNLAKDFIKEETRINRINKEIDKTIKKINESKMDEFNNAKSTNRNVINIYNTFYNNENINLYKKKGCIKDLSFRKNALFKKNNNSKFKVYNEFKQEFNKKFEDFYENNKIKGCIKNNNNSCKVVNSVKNTQSIF